MIYLDHAATTPVDKEVARAMAPFFSREFGNPSSLYKLGREAKQAILRSRQSIAKILHCEPGEIIFTAGGTESDNLAVLGSANNIPSQLAGISPKYHLITSNIEHPAVLNCFKYLEKHGFAVTYLPVDKYGLVNPEEVMKSLRPQTVLVSIMYANNEIGTIQPIQAISQIIKNYRHIQRVDTVSTDPIYPIFHTDACQAAGYLDINVDNLGADLMTLNGSKIYGPKQIGLLYKSKRIRLSPILYGGGQEQGLRPGTENTAAIVGLAKALALANQHKSGESKRLLKLRDYLIMELLKIPDTSLNGHPSERLPNNVNVSFYGVEGESVMLKLDAAGIYVSTGSACHSASLEPSHVIMALGVPTEYAHSSVRFTLGQATTRRDIEKTVGVVKKVVQGLRQISAINHKNIKT